MWWGKSSFQFLPGSQWPAIYCVLCPLCYNYFMKLRYEEPIMSALTSMPDTYEQHLGDTNFETVDPNLGIPTPIGMIVVNSAADLRQVLEDTWHILGTTDTTTIDRNVKHEIEHAEAAMVAGASAVRYVVMYGSLLKRGTDEVIGTVTRPSMTCILPDMDASTLRRAAIIGHPAVPSDGDFEDLHNLGYDIERLNFEARRYNQLNGYQIPLPISASR